jgi:hypothetical protein
MDRSGATRPTTVAAAVRAPSTASGTATFGHRPEAHIAEEAPVRRGGRVLYVDQRADSQHDRRDEHVDPEAVDQPRPAERARRELDAEPPAGPLDFVADRPRGLAHPRAERERGGPVDRDQTIAQAQAGRARGRLGGKEAEIGSGEEAGIRAARVEGQVGHQAHQHREARRDDEREAEAPARHALAAIIHAMMTIHP